MSHERSIHSAQVRHSYWARRHCCSEVASENSNTFVLHKSKKQFHQHFFLRSKVIIQTISKVSTIEKLSNLFDRIVSSFNLTLKKQANKGNTILLYDISICIFVDFVVVVSKNEASTRKKDTEIGYLSIRFDFIEKYFRKKLINTMSHTVVYQKYQYKYFDFCEIQFRCSHFIWMC